jgi:purine-cytosine permease-like protein
MPWHAAYWVGVFYDALSDFGRSMMRPFYAWAVLTLAFAAFYLFTSAVQPPPVVKDAGFFERNLPFTRAAILGELKCAGNELNDISPLGEAGYLAIKNGLIVIGLGSEGKINQAHACLYGGSVGAPVFPSGISIWQIVQNFLSAPLIFLFLLGIRNNFKIK